MVCNDFLFLRIHQLALPFRSSNNTLNRFFELIAGDDLLVTSCRKDGCFINQVLQVCANKARSRSGNFSKVNGRIDRLAFGVYFENGFTPVLIRLIQHHTPVKTARAEQGRVQDIGSVGCCNHDHVGVSSKPVHFNQQLVEGLFALVMASAKTSTTMTTNSIDFINKHNTGRMLLGFVKKIAHTAGTHTDKHFHKFRTGNGEERHASFTRNCFCHQGLTGTR